MCYNIVILIMKNDETAAKGRGENGGYREMKEERCQLWMNNCSNMPSFEYNLSEQIGWGQEYIKTGET